PHLGSDWGSRLSQAGFTIEAERPFAIDLTPPLPTSTGRYARASLRRIRSNLDGRMSADDLATLETLIDSYGPDGVLQRDDLTVRTARTVWVARRPGAARATPGVFTRPPLLGEVEGGTDDALGVDAVVAVDVVDRPELAELGDAERGVRHLVDCAEESQGVRGPREDGHHRRRAGGGEGMVEDPAVPRLPALPRAHGPEQQARAGHAHDVGWDAGLVQPVGGGERLGHDRPHGGDSDLRSLR